MELVSSPSSGHPSPERRGEDGTGSLRRELRELEAELERKERHLQYVIDHYERLLTERDRQLTNQDRPPSGDDGPSIPLSNVLRWLADR